MGEPRHGRRHICDRAGGGKYGEKRGYRDFGVSLLVAAVPGESRVSGSTVVYSFFFAIFQSFLLAVSSHTACIRNNITERFMQSLITKR